MIEGGCMTFSLLLHHVLYLILQDTKQIIGI